MSFGFSIGDIVLLSQLAYNLYSSVNSGRKAASRDLKELEDVLFSLRCALDHLSDVANEVLATAESRSRHGGAPFKEKLDRIIDSCGSTLQELSDVTKKYREILQGDDDNGSGVKKDKRRVLERVKINWRKVRWDQEKQSLQQYREKLRSHADAINMILTSVLWSTASGAESNSIVNHEKTHDLLNQALTNPQIDASLQTMIREIHALLIQPEPSSTSHLVRSSFYAQNAQLGSADDPPRAPKPTPAFALFAAGPSDTREQGHSYTTYAHDNNATPTQSLPATQGQLPASLISLNDERQAFAAREFEEFAKRHPTPTRPSSIAIKPPTIQQLHARLVSIFRPLSSIDSRFGTSQSKDRVREAIDWIEGFRRFVEESSGVGVQIKTLVDLMVALNNFVEKSGTETATVFYEAADQARLMETLEQLRNKSKSVRVAKEIEEFEDTRDEWNAR